MKNKKLTSDESFSPKIEWVHCIEKTGNINVGIGFLNGNIVYASIDPDKGPVIKHLTLKKSVSLRKKFNIAEKEEEFDSCTTHDDSALEKWLSMIEAALKTNGQFKLKPHLQRFLESEADSQGKTVLETLEGILRARMESEL